MTIDRDEVKDLVRSYLYDFNDVSGLITDLTYMSEAELQETLERLQDNANSKLDFAVIDTIYALLEYYECGF